VFRGGWGARGRRVLHQLAIALAAAGACVGAARAVCPGDCPIADDEVTVDELVVGINILSDPRLLNECPSLDQNHDQEVGEAELSSALESALYGCVPAPTPNPTRQPTLTPFANGLSRAAFTPNPNPIARAATADGRDAARSPFFLGLTTAGCNLLGLLVIYRRQHR
jgi:hypothetical protein